MVPSVEQTKAQTEQVFEYKKILFISLEYSSDLWTVLGRGAFERPILGGMHSFCAAVTDHENVHQFWLRLI